MTDRIRILLVENENDIVFVFKRGLEQFGYEVDAFSDPIEALCSFTPKQYDLAILDIRMPNLNGVELAKELLKKDSELIVLFWSAYEYDEPTIKAQIPSLIDGFFIRKPCSLSDLVTHIRRNYVKLPEATLANTGE